MLTFVSEKPRLRIIVLVYLRLPDDVVCAVHLTPSFGISRAIADRLDSGGRVAVMPQGPLTISYLAG